MFVCTPSRGLTRRPTHDWDASFLAAQAAQASSIRDLACRLGVPQSTAERALDRHRIRRPLRCKGVEIDDVRQRRAQGETLAGLSRRFGISRGRVDRIVRQA